MANDEHLAILKQGVKVWNRWRRENLLVRPDLSRADFSGADLSRANLSNADLSEVNLRGTDLSRANLSNADLISAHLSRASLRVAKLIRARLNGANLSSADVSRANLSRASLRVANLIRADLSWADLSQVDFSGVDLSRTNLSQANLKEANLLKGVCNGTTFADVDLSTVKGLDTVVHSGPSYVSVNTLFRSKGKIPDVFLRGCGVPEDLITYLPSLLNKAIQFYSCFISYSHEDKTFARRLHDRLRGEAIRCWLDEHQLNPGDPLHPTIYEAIRVYDKVLLCCSETSLKSWWVDKEFGNAVRKEEDYKDVVLIPLNLDGYLFTPSAESYLSNEIKKRLAADFTNWKDHDGFEKAFQSVVRALRTDGGKPPPPEPKLNPKR